MRLMIIMMLFSLIYLVSGKNHMKTLTESNGQEVIEIGQPIKDLPVGLEEEPGPDDDNDDDDKSAEKTSSNTQVPATKRDSKKTTSLSTVKKEVERTEALSSDEDEARIEKELAEIYKDTADYKSDSGEETEVGKDPKANVEKATDDTTEYGDELTEDADKPVGRDRSNNFKFQPDFTDQASIEKFRTSVDEINCNNRQKLSGLATNPTTELVPKKPSTAFRTVGNGIMIITAVLSYVFICT